MKKNWLALFPDCFAASLSSSFYQHTWKTVDHAHEVVSRPAHARARFLTVHAALLTRFLTSRKLDRL